MLWVQRDVVNPFVPPVHATENFLKYYPNNNNHLCMICLLSAIHKSAEVKEVIECFGWGWCGG